MASASASGSPFDGYARRSTPAPDPELTPVGPDLESVYLELTRGRAVPGHAVPGGLSEVDKIDEEHAAEPDLIEIEVTR